MCSRISGGDGNKLYNYMLKCSLLDKMKIHLQGDINLIRDNKNVKVKSGNSLGDYLEITLWFDLNHQQN